MPSSNRRTFWVVASAAIGLYLLLVALPQSWKQWAPAFIRNTELHLGLDLAGGTQLDFRISEEEIRNQRAQIAEMERQGRPATEIEPLRAQQLSIDEQEKNLVEAIRTVLERRINALGVSEATITPSYFGNEKHLLVECPGVVDVQQCIEVVGKTIQLEFKEEFTEASDEYVRGVRAKANEVYNRITVSGSTLQKEGQLVGSQLGVAYQDTVMLFRDQLPKGLEDLWNAQPNRGVQRREGSVSVPRQDGSGETDTVPGIFLVEVVGARTQTGRVINEAPKAFEALTKTETGATYTYQADRALDNTVNGTLAATLRAMTPGQLNTVTLDDSSRVLFLRGSEKGGEKVNVSHILVAYQGATGAPAGVTRTKEQALAKAKDLQNRLKGGAAFADVARAETDATTSKNAGGSLGEIGRGELPKSFEDVAFTQQPGIVSEPVETPYGYHLIRVNSAPKTSPDKVSYDELKVTGVGAAARAADILQRLQTGKVTSTEEVIGLRYLFFSLAPTGWKDTTLDGKHFRAATVALDPVTNIPVVQIAFDTEGGRLFQELTKKNVGKRIAIFVGGELVSAPVVQQEISGGIAVITGSSNVTEARLLAQDLNTGAIPAPIYLVGQYTLEATLGDVALQTSLNAALVGTIILMLYMLAVYGVLGLVADLALLLYGIMLFAIMKLPVLLITDSYIVLTVAGMAGIILSIGLAVDANVLVFERMKEELRKGKTLKNAVEGSFKHAWPAIRDSNVATLITASILFIIGTSIVRGFAVTLGMGAILSLFTAVTVTRWLLRKLVASGLVTNPRLYGLRKGERGPLS